MVRAKFTVISITDYGSCTKQVVLQPQYDPTIPEDRRFCAATPFGRLEMGIDNQAATEQLKIGRAFYLDLTQAD